MHRKEYKMKPILLSEIIIPKKFRDSVPTAEKLDRVRKYYEDNNCFDKPIVVDKNNVLVDNYLRYLVALENEITEVPCVTQEHRQREITYVVGVFDGYPKEYTWKLTKNIPIVIGDKVAVVSKGADGKNRICIVTVVKLFTSNNPELLKHKNVIGKYKKVNGK